MENSDYTTFEKNQWKSIENAEGKFHNGQRGWKMSTPDSLRRKDAKRKRQLKKLIAFIRKNSPQVLRDLKFASNNNEFISDIRFKMINKPHYFFNGRSPVGLSEKQADAVSRCAEGRRKYERLCEKADAGNSMIPSELNNKRSNIIGKIVSKKWKDTNFGSTLKAVIKCGNEEEGYFLLWGTMPELAENWTDDGNGGKYENDNNFGEVGTEISFDAKITISPKDDAFGFFSRPTKGRLA